MTMNSISLQVRDKTFSDILDGLTEKRALVRSKVTELGNATQQEIAKELGVQVHAISGRFTELCNLHLLKQVGERSIGNYRHTVYAPINSVGERNMMIATDIANTEHLIDAIESDMDKIATLQLSESLKHIINKEHKRATKRLKELKEMVL